MPLSSELISQFVKITNDNKDTTKESTVYGTTVSMNGTTYVQIDGSELYTPINTTADVQPNERVIVMIKNHTALITGNITSPSARATEVKQNQTEVNQAISSLETNVSQNQTAVSEKITSLETNKLSVEQADEKYADVNFSNIGAEAATNLRAILGSEGVLWAGGLVMDADDSATFSQLVSEQLNGIILVFSKYSNGAVSDTAFSCHFIPKQIVSSRFPHTFILSTPNFESVGVKNLYIGNDSITGHSDNTTTGTAASGITYANGNFALRYVIGV